MALEGQREHLEVRQQKIKEEYKTYNLTGAWLNNAVTYADASTAWLTSTGVLSWVASAVYEKLAGSGHFNGVKVIRGYSEPKFGDSDTPSAEPMVSDPGSIDEIQEEDEAFYASAKARGLVELLGSRTDSTYDNDDLRRGVKDREIEHLVLVTHGIGQSISIR
jgi:hypothetical protein